MSHLNELFCEGWMYLGGSKENLPTLNWLSNQDSSVSFHWEAERYISCHYSINRSKVSCREFPDENLDIDFENDLGTAVQHLHMIATQAVDDCWPFVLTEEERTRLNRFIARHLNAEFRELLDFTEDVLPLKEETGDLSDEDFASIVELAGGQESYKDLIVWASERLPQAEIQRFDDVVESGNTEAIKIGVRALLQQRLAAQAVGQG
ncbi:hypothetical protein [Synechococcus sp. A15-62]|uniref:hypothetical protein n=1 Tax=Synechococcus sp. A15-62 TaxID=1050657 RepID=UPI0016461BD8|nr:hypothetical protein [Synechococcus sp. A15-62]